MISSFSVVSFMDDDDVVSSSELLSASVEKLGRPVVTIGVVTTKGLWIRVAAGCRKLLQLPGRRLCCAT